MALELQGLVLILAVGVVIVGLVAAFSSRIGIAGPLLLVVVGVGLGLVPDAPRLELEPHTFLSVVLPPLIYIAALSVPIVDFRRNLRVILMLSVALVALSALAVGAAVHLVWPAVAFSLALALGAVVAPPDAVAATAIAKRLGLPTRNVTILEGEALLNDATALVILSLAATVVTAHHDVTAGEVFATFLWAVFSAAVIGVLGGIVSVWAREKVHEKVFDIAVSLVTPFIIFIVTELVHGSGIVAVALAGIYVGNASAFRLRAEMRKTEHTNWETVRLLLENGVFLYMGYQMPHVVAAVIEGSGSLVQVVLIGVLITVVLLVVRLLFMPTVIGLIRLRARRLRKRNEVNEQRLSHIREKYGETQPLNFQIDARTSRREVKKVLQGAPRHEGVRNLLHLKQQRFRHDLTAERDQALDWKDGLVLGWAGMRGVVTVVAVETIPKTAEWDSIVLIAYVVAVLTLLGYGLTLPALARALKLRRDDTARQEAYELRTRIAEIGREAFEREVRQGHYEQIAVKEVRDILDRRDERIRVLSGLHEEFAKEEAYQAGNLIGVAVDAQRRALHREHRAGRYSAESIALALQMLNSDSAIIGEFDRLSDET